MASKYDPFKEQIQGIINDGKDRLKWSEIFKADPAFRRAFGKPSETDTTAITRINAHIRSGFNTGRYTGSLGRKPGAVTKRKYVRRSQIAQNNQVDGFAFCPKCGFSIQLAVQAMKVASAL